MVWAGLGPESRYVGSQSSAPSPASTSPFAGWQRTELGLIGPQRQPLGTAVCWGPNMCPSVPPLRPVLSALTFLRDTVSHPACDQGLCHPSGPSGSSIHPQIGKRILARGSTEAVVAEL